MKLPGNGANIPILGQTVEQVPAQLRLNVAIAVGQALDGVKQLGLRHGRAILHNPIDSNDLGYLLWIDALEDAGGRVVSINEVPVQGPGGRPMLQVHVLFRLPEPVP